MERFQTLSAVSPSEHGFVVQSVDDDRVEELCALFRCVFHHDVGAAVWAWKYHDPALAGRVNIVLTAGEEVVGHAGAVIMPGVLDGRVLPFAQVCDVMLAPAVRGQFGPGGAYAILLGELIAALQARIPEGMFYGFPGRRPFRLGERLGFYRGTGPVLEYSQAVRALRWWQNRVLPLSWDDKRIDRLWREREAAPGCWLVRDRRYLGWRYARKPGAAYRLLGLWSRNGLRDWAVVTVQGDTLVVIDRLGDAGDLPLALAQLGHWAGRQGLARISWWATGDTVPTVGVQSVDTGMIGVVMPSSAPAFARCAPAWQPGDTDVR